MEVVITDLPNVPEKTHPLLVESKFPANILGSYLFVQLVSSLSENPVKFILHDKMSGKRKLFTVTCKEEAKIVPEVKPVPQLVKIAIPKVEPNDRPKGSTSFIKIPKKP